MGQVNPSLPEGCLISGENDEGNDGSTKQSIDMSSKEKNSRAIPLSYFIELAEKQVLTEPVKKRMKASAMGPNVPNVESTMKHVADIVLVLSGLGLLRGGREPTDEERRLLAEAYGNLGFLVQQLYPRDLMSKNFVENLIEDLGLKRPKDQEVKTFAEILEGFQPPASSMLTAVERTQNGIDADGMGLEDQDSVSASRSMAGNDDTDELPPELPLPFEGGILPGQEPLVQQATEVPAGPYQIIQTLLQTRYPADYKFQAAHPRTFMSAAMPCEMCKLTVRDTTSVLVCDTCDKVHHLRCLQSYLLMGIPKWDWHCPKCSGEGGRELHHAPMYGRVKAGFSFAKGATIEGPAKMIPTQKIRQADGHTPKKAQPAVAAQKPKEHIPSSNQPPKNPVVSGNLGGTFTALLGSFAQAEEAGRSNMLKPGQIPNNSEQSSSLPHTQTTTRSSLSSLQAREPPLTRSSAHLLQSGKVAGRDNKATESASSANGSKQSKSTDESESYDDTSMGSDEGECENPVKEADRFGIEWVGDILYEHDDKSFYSACTVGGCLYKLQDCALFRPETSNVPPYIARLQALWEDANTGSKWVRVNWCYHPSDMATIAGRPPNPEVHEVYESNHGDNNLVGTIQGQCLVLQPESYLKEMERRQELLKGGTTGESLVPVFLCKWFYDVASATFRPAPQVP